MLTYLGGDRMGRPSKYVIAYNDVVELLCNQRLSIPLAAKQLKCSCDSLRNYVQTHNIKLPKSRVTSRTPFIQSINPDEIQQLLQDKYTFREIAEKYDCTESSVANFVKQHNMTVHRYNDVPDELTLRNLYCSELLTLNEIASQFGVSTDRIKRALEEYDIVRSDYQQKLFEQRTASRISDAFHNRFESKYSYVPKGERLYNEVVSSSLASVRRKYDISYEVLTKLLKESGHSISRLEPIDRDVLQRLVNEGRTYKEIGNIVNRSDATVSKYIKEYGITRSEEGESIYRKRISNNARKVVLDKHASSIPTAEQLQELVNNYMNYTEIADMFGCSNSVIGNCVSRYSTQLPDDYDKIVIQNYVEKGQNTILQRYGVFPYGLVKYGEKAQTILTDSDKLREFLLSIPLKDRTLSRCSYDLEVPEYLLTSYINRYELNIEMAAKLGSSLEEQLRHSLDNWGVSYIRNNKKIISPKEIDFYFKGKKLGIEVNGNWAHSTTSSGKYVPISKDYHKSKTILCREKSVRLIHLFEYEMSNTNSWHKLQRFLHDVICEPSRIAYARKLQIRAVDKDAEREFLNYNHLQGYIGSRVCLGLFDRNELVMIMSFGKPRYNINYEWELLRLCTKSDVAVIGGAEKLFKHFVNNYSPNSIVSYCDLSKFEGKVYSRLGMKLVRESAPNYRWVRFNEVFTRYQTQKHKLSKLLGDSYDSSLSESDNMIKAGFLKVYDCGNAVYEWRR